MTSLYNISPASHATNLVLPNIREFLQYDGIGLNTPLHLDMRMFPQSTSDHAIKLRGRKCDNHGYSMKCWQSWLRWGEKAMVSTMITNSKICRLRCLITNIEEMIIS